MVNAEKIVVQNIENTILESLSHDVARNLPKDLKSARIFSSKVAILGFKDGRRGIFGGRSKTRIKALWNILYHLSIFAHL